MCVRERELERERERDEMDGGIMYPTKIFDLCGVLTKFLTNF